MGKARDDLKSHSQKEPRKYARFPFLRQHVLEEERLPDLADEFPAPCRLCTQRMGQPRAHNKQLRAAAVLPPLAQIALHCSPEPEIIKEWGKNGARRDETLYRRQSSAPSDTQVT